MSKRRRGHGWSSVGRKRLKCDRFSINPKQLIVQTSSIPHAGRGLFLVEPVKKGERIAIYSGKPMDKSMVQVSKSEYIVQVSSNVFLDGGDVSEKGKGKYINCGRKSKLKINSEFASGRTYNYRERPTFIPPKIPTNREKSWFFDDNI